MCGKRARRSRSTFFFCALLRLTVTDQIDNGKAIRQGKWKLVRARTNPWELYDMDKDRTELNNFAEEHPEKVQALEKQWEAWRDPKTFSK